MISPKFTCEFFQRKGINFFTGVPDSLLKDFCAYITDNVPNQNHLIAANEGNAIALATGYYLGTGKPSLVYLQNSGLGNIVNPILSLADKELYKIPLIILLGWRGEPGIKDEPQHIKQGRITPKLLEALELNWFEIGPQLKNTENTLIKAFESMEESQSPTIILVRKGSFSKYSLKKDQSSNYTLTREKAIKTTLSNINNKDLVISTTGMASREVFEHRVELGENHNRDFLTVGSMGHTSSIALGLAISRSDRNIICLDGDGSVLMHLGSMAIQGVLGLSNFVHIVLNNAAHDSVGGQPTVAQDINLPLIAKNCGYKHIASVDSSEGLKEKLKQFLPLNTGPKLIEVLVKKGSRMNLGRPTKTPLYNKNEFMANIIN